MTDNPQDRALKAKTILEDPFFNEQVLDVIESRIVSSWKNARSREDQAYAHDLLTAHRMIRGVLNEYVAHGKVEDEKLKRQSEQSEAQSDGTYW